MCRSLSLRFLFVYNLISFVDSEFVSHLMSSYVAFNRFTAFSKLKIWIWGINSWRYTLIQSLSWIMNIVFGWSYTSFIHGNWGFMLCFSRSKLVCKTSGWFSCILLFLSAQIVHVQLLCVLASFTFQAACCWYHEAYLCWLLQRNLSFI